MSCKTCKAGRLGICPPCTIVGNSLCQEARHEARKIKATTRIRFGVYCEVNGRRHHKNGKAVIPKSWNDPGFMTAALAEISRQYPGWSIHGYYLAKPEDKE